MPRHVWHAACPRVIACRMGIPHLQGSTGSEKVGGLPAAGQMARSGLDLAV